MEEFNPKKENIPYTIGIIKPDVAVDDTKVPSYPSSIFTFLGPRNSH